jgi:hypothetical protein
VRVTTKIVFDMDGNVLQHEWYEYQGPVALCDRWAQGQDKKNAGTAGDLATKSGATADTEHSTLGNFYNGELNAEHMYDPTQTNELLTAAGAGIGAASGAVAHDTDMLAGRTRNESGFTKSLQEQARDKMKASAGVSEGVAAQDVMGAKQLNQEGASGLSHLFDSDQSEQMKAMGLQAQDTAAEVEAGKSGWLQNMNDTIKAIGSLGGGKGIKGIAA